MTQPLRPEIATALLQSYESDTIDFIRDLEMSSQHSDLTLKALLNYRKQINQAVEKTGVDTKGLIPTIESINTINTYQDLVSLRNRILRS